MSKWDETLRRWRSAAFPRGSHLDGVDELHAELAYWDAMVADAAIPLDKGQRVPGGFLDVKAGLAELRMKLELCPRDSEEARDRVVRYLKLLEDVEALVEPRLDPS
jgi:hypothetical protein